METNPNEKVYQAQQELVTSLARCTRLIEEHMMAAGATISEAIDALMTRLSRLSDVTSKKSKQAQELLETTYVSPDKGVEDLIAKIQRDVDNLLDGKVETSTSPETEPSESHMRFGGHFSKRMEALTMIDQDASEAFLKLVGALSSDDVIKQKIEHICQSMQALEAGLASTINMKESPFTFQEIHTLQNDILTYTYGIYTTETEKETFRSHFGTPKF